MKYILTSFLNYYHHSSFSYILSFVLLKIIERGTVDGVVEWATHKNWSPCDVPRDADSMDGPRA
jgi:hypothetical protein